MNVKSGLITRRERAARTRTRIVEAAYQLFCQRGWEGTTMQLVAEQAGVAVQTVYFTFRTKAQLLAATEEHAIGWDTTPHEFMSRWTKRLSSEQDPRSLIRRFVEADTRIKARLTPLVIGLGGSMPPDAEPARDRESGRDRFFGSLVDRLAELGALPSGLGRRRALDITRTLNQQQAYSDLTRRRGWSDEEWSAWMTDLLSSQLLR